MFLFDLVVEARHLEAKDVDGMKLQKINSSTTLIFFSVAPELFTLLERH